MFRKRNGFKIVVPPMSFLWYGVHNTVHTKRTKSVTVKLSQADLDRFLACQRKKWPQLDISRSSLIRALANLGCDYLERTKKKPKGLILWAFCCLPWAMELGGRLC